MKTCFVSMPFGRKRLQDNGSVQDFDAVYNNAIKPALAELGYDPRRADELGGYAVIHKAQLAAIMNSEVMIADVSMWNANVMYQLGLRHAVNPSPTIVLVNERERLPYDLAGIYAIRYALSGEAPTSDEAAALRQKLKEALGSIGLLYDRYRSPLHDLFPELHVDRPRKPCVFIGHGRSKLWSRLQIFIADELHLTTVSYESESRVGLSIVPILQKMLGQATFAVLILTGEDETAEGSRRARQNVIHEAGLFQGHLSFERVVLLLQNGLEEFSNVAGLQYIGFQGDSIEQTFYELQRALKREGLLK
jgi:predicted nucleotide-binding protein